MQKLMKIIARINDVSDPYALMKLREVFESDINDGVSYGFYTEKAYLVAIEAVINSRLAELGYIGKNDLKGTSHK